MFFSVSTAQIFDTQCRWCHQGHQAADHEGPRCPGELIIGKSWMRKWPQTVNVHLLLLLDKTSTMLTVKHCVVCVWDKEDTHLTADLLWHIWCDVLGAQQSPSHLSCVKLKKLLILYDFLFCWNMGSQSCAIPYWQLSFGLNVAYWPIHLLHDWPLPFSQLSSVQWTVLCLCFVSVSGNLL